MLRARKKTANGLADWTRSEPTTAGIAERSADRRRRLSRLALVERRPPDQDGGTEIVFNEATTRGGTLVSSLRSEPRTFNRIAATGVPVDLYSILTGSKLVRVNRATQEVEPALVESWTVSPDNLTYTLTLRDGVTWSDGVAFTSADVLFSFQAIYDPKVGSPLASVASHRRQAAHGDRARCADGGRQPAEHLRSRHRAPRQRHRRRRSTSTKPRSRPASSRRRSAWPRRPPTSLSIGPFKLTSYAPGQRLVFDRNPRYWKKDAAGTPLPYLDQVILEIVPDQNAELVRLQSGQFDMLQQQIRPEDIATLRPLEQQGKLKLIELGVGADPDSFFFNLRSPYWAKDPRRDWITRKEFRHAISHAIDREAFANTVFLGAGVPIWGPVTPGNQKWFSPNVPRLRLLARAREGDPRRPRPDQSRRGRMARGCEGHRGAFQRPRLPRQLLARARRRDPARRAEEDRHQGRRGAARTGRAAPAHVQGRLRVDPLRLQRRPTSIRR